MKKIVLNICESTYEKLRFEAILENKSVQKIIEERIFFKQFAIEIEEAFDQWMQEEVQKIIKG